MNELETRVRHQLATDARRLPTPSPALDAVVRRGRQRRLRARLALTGSALAVVAGGVVAAGSLGLADQSPDAVIADQPDLTVDESGEDLVDERGNPVPDQPSSAEDPASVDPDATNPEADPDGSVDQADDDRTADDQSTAAEPEPDPDSTAPPGPQPATAVLPESSIRFATDHEGCESLSDPRAHPDWIEGQGNDSRNADGTRTYGFAYNSGDATTGQIDWRFTARPDAPSGQCVAALTLGRADDPRADDAVRLIRRYDNAGRPLPDDAWYSAWLYFPEDVAFDNRTEVDGQTVLGFWTVLSFKSHVPAPGDTDADGDDGDPLSTFSIGAGRLTNDDDGMALTVYRRTSCGSNLNCPEAGMVVQEDPVPIPVGRWVHVEVHLRARTGQDGLLEVWQDGHKVIEIAGQTERAGATRRTWSVTSAGRLHHPATHTLYADDVVIATEPVHPHLFPSAD